MQRQKPYRNARIITIAGLGDATPFPEGTIAGVKIDASGSKANLAVVMDGGQDIVIEGLASNVIHEIAIKQIKQTGTTATKVTIFW